jgi:hypothetical protein
MMARVPGTEPDAGAEVPPPDAIKDLCSAKTDDFQYRWNHEPGLNRRFDR